MAALNTVQLKPIAAVPVAIVMVPVKGQMTDRGRAYAEVRDHRVVHQRSDMGIISLNTLELYTSVATVKRICTVHIFWIVLQPQRIDVNRQ